MKSAKLENKNGIKKTERAHRAHSRARDRPYITMIEKGDTPCFLDTSHKHPFKIIKKLYNHLC